jgi:hypothetical protein
MLLLTAAADLDCCCCRLEAVNAYFHAVETLMFDLSIWRCR